MATHNTVDLFRIWQKKGHLDYIWGGGGDLTFNFQNVGKGMEKSLLLRPTLRLTLVVQRPIFLQYQSYLEVNHRAGKNGAPSVAGSIK